jgi:hypothetical protein
VFESVDVEDGFPFFVCCYKFDYYLILELDLVYKILGWRVIVCSPRSVFMFNLTVASSMFDSLNVRRFCVPDGLMYFFYFSLLQ